MNNTNIKPTLSLWQIWNMCFGFLGIQFGFALQNANIGRIFQTLGAEISELPILFLAAPVTGLLLQPLIGYMSDRTWTRIGRRRPYFLWGAIFSTLALFIIPNATALWVCVIGLWLLNSAINVSMEPFRSFVCDMLPNEQRTRGFAMQAFFIGVGSVVASALPWIFTNWFNVSNTAAAGHIPDSVLYSFYLGGFAFLSAVLVTVISTKEYTDEQLAAFEAHEKSLIVDAPQRPVIHLDAKILFKDGVFWTLFGIFTSTIVYMAKLPTEFYVLTAGVLLYGALHLITSYLYSTNRHGGLSEVMHDIRNMPKPMVRLALVQFFSWFALFSMWIYTTSAVTDHHYHTTDTTSAIFNEGANWVGILMAAYNAFAALAAFIIPIVARKTSRKTAHMINLCMGGAGLISFYFIKDPMMLLVSMIGVGFAWASILSMPYAILAGSLPANKAGIYMGIFNLFITIPQILASTILGLMVHRLFAGHTIYALMVGGLAFILGAIATFWVHDEENKEIK